MKTIRNILLLSLLIACGSYKSSDNVHYFEDERISYINGDKKYFTLRKYQNQSSFTEFGILCQDTISSNCALILRKQKKDWYLQDNDSWILLYDNSLDSLSPLNILDIGKSIEEIERTEINGKSVIAFKFQLSDGSAVTHNPYYFFDGNNGIIAFGRGSLNSHLDLYIRSDWK
jgi:hypothetical protein